MQMAAAVCVSAKNEMCRKGGKSLVQWVLGKYPRGVARLLEDEELGQLGALEGHVDSATEWGLRAQYRLTSMKHYVKQDCSRRYMKAMLISSRILG